ncbi:FAD synthase [Malassezia cuniculi]|uniref:FAD synthase n=1 Tax=Malassezia cuniculi TaxID=948313 RepID=A0AAF0EW07_9BASI|nr:FAD synthase [Malassezia cuniculi]
MHEPPSAWIRSIDAVYAFVEDESVRSKYPALAERVLEAVQTCERALETYGAANCALSFNGGKDCIVLAHILAAVLRRKAPNTEGIPKLHGLYVACASPFPELEDFIRYSSSQATGYNIDLTWSKGDIRDVLADWTGQNTTYSGVSHRHIRAMFIGVRRIDPHGAALALESPCDPDWPPMMRIHPILNWEYADIWAFLRSPVLATNLEVSAQGVTGGGSHGVPYCILYDRGYTSLGSTFNTRPNPLLEQSGEYAPAYELQDASAERAGRG